MDNHPQWTLAWLVPIPKGYEDARNCRFPESSGAWRAFNPMPSGTPIGVRMRLRLATGGAPNGDRRLISEIPIGIGRTWVKYSRDPDDPAPPMDSLETVKSTPFGSGPTVSEYDLPDDHAFCQETSSLDVPALSYQTISRPSVPP